jgi:CrcB protein
VERAARSSFPFGTLIVNVIGSFLICAIIHLASAGIVSPVQRLALTTGFLGGFTTYSAFAYETLACFDAKAWRLGLLNIAATVVLGLLAGALGFACARRLFPN